VDDRTGRLATIGRDGNPVTIELGCGPRKRVAGSIGIDIRPYDGVDVVGDVHEVLRRLPPASVDSVHSSHVLEHLDDLCSLMKELRRIVKPGGLVVTVVPHFSNPYYYSDYTHRRQFGLYSFSYLAHDSLLRRRVPLYDGDPGFELLDVRLGFKASPPMYLRHGLRRLLGVLVNASRFTQEWYEAGWCWFFPCYEIEFVIRRRLDATPETPSAAGSSGSATMQR